VSVSAFWRSIEERDMAVKIATSKPPSGYRMAAKGDRGEIYLYGAIGGDFFGGGVSAKQFADDLKAMKSVKTIDLRINSEGGDVFDGKTMYSLLRDHGAKIVVHVDGLAASAASFVAMAGDEIMIAEGAFIMIHNPWTVAVGNAADLRQTADLLDTVGQTIADVYAARTKQPMAKITQWLADETWMTADESVKNGFADTMVANLKVAASVREPSRYKHLPSALFPKRAAALAKIEDMKAARG
jgi:ATP-dependent protease ClpP protease subunit